MKKTTKLFYLIIAILKFGGPSAFAQPTASAPMPTAPATQVISIFSNAYTDVVGTNFFPNWNQVTTYNAIKIGETDDVIKYADMNYQGIQFGSTQDVSSMKYLHIDVWTTDPNAATFPIALIWGAEKVVTKAVATNGTWTSLNIPLSEFTGAVLTTAIQLKLVSNEWNLLGAAGNSSKYTTVYIDNIYFWTDVVPPLNVSTNILTIAQPTNSTQTFDITTTGAWTLSSNQSWLAPSSTSGTGNATITLTAQANPTYDNRKANVTIVGSSTTKIIAVTQSSLIPAPAPAPTMPTSQVKSIYSDVYTPAVTVREFSNWWNMIITDCTFATGDNGKIMNTTASGNCGSPTFNNTPLNASDMTQLHVDVFPTSAMDIGLKLVSLPPYGESEGWVSLGTLIPNQWNSVNVPLSTFLMLSKTTIQQVGFVTTNSFGSFYMDNLYFHTGATAVNNVYADKSIVVYPTTVFNKLNIKSENEMTQVVVRNLVGQDIKTVSISGYQGSIDLSDLSSGNYIVTVSLINGLSSTRKIVKF